jgi:hypothetical protein
MEFIVRPMRWLPLALAALVACTQKDAKSISKSQVDPVANGVLKIADTNNLFGASAPQYGPPKGKIRVANLLELGDKPSVALDLYDMPRPDSAAVPLIKNLAFGQVSDYVSPRGTFVSNLYMFPAGKKQSPFPYATSIDHAGFDSTDQITVALGPTYMNGTPVIAFPALDEAGHRVNSYRESLRVIPAGTALLVVLQANTSLDSIPLLYLMIDGTCPLTSVYPKNKIPTALGTDINFAVSPGAHTLGIVTSPRGFGLLNCAGKKPGATTTANVVAGKRYIVFVYGTPSDGFKTLVDTIAGQ